ncbi:structural maintenance of chromosomes 3 [Olea europaea subsp. europaea]|uniref:Structural maintenance of chromosomes 3 n=1 Tax=Olea europaea subsp. europaea TaxID=158383 RepID=A0A8S0UYZ8_OLEEU|nr:structural maintenance of chromosomes 3 [Olea europaea subsp. europaea]
METDPYMTGLSSVLVPLWVLVFAEYVPWIDQKINELVSEQQKNDAKLAHEKSELEQLRQDAANALKSRNNPFLSHLRRIV